MEQKYAKTYSQLCQFLINGLVENTEKKSKKNNFFFTSLLSKIQDVFEGGVEIIKTKSKKKIKLNNF